MKQTVLSFFTCLCTLAAAAQSNQVPAAPLEAIPPSNPPTTNANPAQVDPFDDPLIRQVQSRHEKAVNGDIKETKSLTSDLEKWTKEQPTNYLLQAYLGSVYTLDSRDAWPGPGKLSYLKNGGKLMDDAVAAAPDNPAVRFIRAIDYYELPFFFGKGKTASDDFQILLKQIDGTEKTPYALNAETQQAIYYYAGLSFRKLSRPADAKATWIKGLALNPSSDLGVKITTELGKMR
jgi:hypothetical protein